jgi:hypothetical protein
VFVDHCPVALAFAASDYVNSEVFYEVVEAVEFPALGANAEAIPVFEHKTYPAVGFLFREGSRSTISQ